VLVVGALENGGKYVQGESQKKSLKNLLEKRKRKKA
jgi:hypothetical protein